MKTVRIGSRKSALAIAQAEIVAESIRTWDPAIRTEIVTITTDGDRYLDRPVGEIGGKAVFVKELERALLDGAVDICVHSLKDMEARDNPLLPICAVSEREDARDVLVFPNSTRRITKGRAIGCSSQRRCVQLAKLYPGIPVLPVRGNVLTRLEKLDAGEYGALVLAAAGLKRLGLGERISRYFTVQQMLPACCQGIIAVQNRAGEPAGFLTGFHDRDTWDAALAERAFLHTMGGGCGSSATAYAQVSGEKITVSAYTVDRRGELIHAVFSGDRIGAARLGIQLAAYLRDEAESR